MKRSLQLTGVCLFVLLLLTTSCHPSKKTSGGNPPAPRDSVCKEITGRLLSKAAELANDSALLEVYVLKESADTNKQDFNLAVFLRTSADRYIDSTWTGDRKQFENVEANYFRSLKKRNIPISQVSTAYTITLDWARVNVKKGLNICILLPNGNMNFTFYSNTQSGEPLLVRMDSACCRCPPQCPRLTAPMLHTEKILKEVYESKAE